jgi:hypothetical protein
MTSYHADLGTQTRIFDQQRNSRSTVLDFRVHETIERLGDPSLSIVFDAQQICSSTMVLDLLVVQEDKMMSIFVSSRVMRGGA